MEECSHAHKLPQILAALSACLGAMGMGMSMAWTSPALPHILKEQCGHTCDLSDVTTEEGSWIGGLLPFGAILSGPITAYFLVRIGRRPTMILFGIPLTLGFGFFALAYRLNSVLLIYIGRLVTGIAGCSYGLSAPIYIVETCDASMRGALSSLMSLMSVFGIGLVNALSIEDAVHWQNISLLCIIAPVLMMICMFLMPETPCYLLSKGKQLDALSSLNFLRGSHYNIQKELDQLQEQKSAHESLGPVSFKALFTTDFYFKPMLLVTMLMVLQQFSGINAILFYTQTIFIAAGSSIDAGLCSTIVCFTQVIFMGVAALLVEKCGRKILLLLSCILMGVSLFTLGVYFYLRENSSSGCLVATDQQGNDTLQTQAVLDYPLNATNVKAQCVPQYSVFSTEFVDSISWFPLSSLVIYTVAFSLGIGPLPWAVCADIFMPEIKTRGFLLAVTINWISCLLVTKGFANLEQLINTSGAFVFFSMVCAIGTLLILAFLPETKGKLPQDIKWEFSRKEGKMEDKK